MTTTRAGKTKGHNDLKHVVNIVMERDDNSPLWLCLLQIDIENMGDLMSLSERNIQALTYTDKEGDKEVTKPIRVGDMGILRVFNLYVIHLSKMGTPVVNDFQSISPENFNLFRIGPDLQGYLNQCGYTATTPPGMTTRTGGNNPGGNARTVDPLADFKRGIKRDASLFSEFEDVKQWDN